MIRKLIVHFIEADPANWNIPKDKIPDGVRGGEGGFMPFGFAGMFEETKYFSHFQLYFCVLQV